MREAETKVVFENPVAERAAIGALVANTTSFIGLKERVTPALFAVDRHQEIAKAMAKLVDDHRSLNVAAIIGAIGFVDWHPEGYLGACIADACHPDEIEDTILDLEKMQARREILRFSEALAREARATEDPIMAIEKAKLAVNQIGDIFHEQVRPVGDIAKGVVLRVDKAFQANKVEGISYGLKGIQDLMGPLLGGRVYLIAGAPGAGKSALASQIAETIAETHPVLFDQIEMPAEEQVERMLAQRAGVSSEAIERAALDAEEFERVAEASERIRPLHLWIDSSTGPTVGQIAARARRMKRQHGIVTVFVDNMLYLVTPDTRMKEHEAVRANLQGLKKLAKSEDIAVVALTHLTKEYATGIIRRPRVSDLYGGSANEQEADVILLLFREEYMLRRAEPMDETSKEHVEWRERLANCEGQAEAILGKRRGGRGYGLRRLYFDAERTRFHDNAQFKPRDPTRPQLFDKADIPIPV